MPPKEATATVTNINPTIDTTGCATTPPTIDVTKPRTRSIVQQAATLASAIQKADAEDVKEDARHVEKKAEIQAKRDKATAAADEEVLLAANRLLGRE